MYKHMLVLLDGSESAEVVFKYAQELSGRLNLDLELLHVCTPAEAEQLPMRRAYMDHMADLLCRGAERVREAMNEERAAGCIQARGTVLKGHPAEEILRYVDANRVDLIMMSTHGRSGIKEWDNIGGVASKVLHASRVPVWLVPSELRGEIINDTLPKRTLVIPLNGSPLAEAAVPHALGIAKQREAESEIVLLGVLDAGLISVSRAMVHDKERAYGRLKEYLAGVADSIRVAGFAVRTEVLAGEPAESIIGFLKANPPQLICMATRGKTGLTKAVFAGVTENVIRLIKKTPMLLVSGTE